jgi:hypothetical protein
MRWKQVVEAARAAGVADETAPGRLRVVRRYEIGGEPIEQVVTASRGAAAGRDWLVLSAAVDADYAIGLADALAHNASLALGALCLAEGGYLLRAAMPLAECTIEGLAHAVDLVGHEAARLRRQARVLLTDAAPATFAAYAD